MLMNFSILLALSAYLILSFFGPNNNSSVKNIYLLGFSACFSVALLFGWVFSGCPATTASLSWFSSYLGSFRCSLVFDFLSSTFFAVGLAVTWSIIEFSHYYMATDPNSSRFIRILILFLFFMLLLVASNNLFLLFVGWEGVGILSFVLIGWWFTRSDANSAALQAIIYNRIGDSGIIILLSYTIIFNNTWNLQEIIYSTQPSGIYNWCVIGIIIAAAGKSAQFSLHPWLPSAMEGPTPVSALLHSSTMVVAGIFLLIRTSSMIENHPWGLSLVGLMGALTALFAASAALVQYDFKKVVAYSTTSQLGLMAVAVGLNLPYLAFFHICTHAFFKALLFLCSGSIIHSYNNEQDIRKMGNAANNVPYTTAAVIIASLALCGLPFLAGFYSKDLILEAGQISLTNSINTVLALIATLMTASYSLRVIFFVSHPQPNTPPLTPVSEENTRLLNALSRLLIGALGAGWALTLSLFSNSPLLVPITLKNLPILLTVIAFLALATNNLNLNSKTPTNFLGSNWFFVQITHTNLSILTLISSLKGVLRTLDQGWNIGLPHGTLSIISNLLNLVQNSMSGSIVKYIFASTLLASTVFLTLALFY
uniref:NADH-ubiquinone oxidoreductase chain 5 n=1 Tax=Ophiopholis mirabilis TaxID=2705304 RepID=A0A6C0FD86_9ECHI|nr:NADH dehydrogenase subunit 5 [Ophiopholis mirabilis]QHT54268.1 NADH dehydrogenase subunit 5 [Ophiopholis mirabilis]